MVRNSVGQQGPMGPSKKMEVRVGRDMLQRVRQVQGPRESLSEFVRLAIEREIARRREGEHAGGIIASIARWADIDPTRDSREA